MKYIEKLIKVSTYAKKYNVSVTWVNKLIETGKIELVKIDGVKFIKEV